MAHWRAHFKDYKKKFPEPELVKIPSNGKQLSTSNNRKISVISEEEKRNKK